MAKKRHVGRLYSKLLQGVRGLTLPPDVDSGGEENIYWVYGVVLQPEVVGEAIDADAVMKILAERKIGTRPFFWGIHEQPVLHKMGHCVNVSCPNASKLARLGFYLPSGLALTDEEIAHVAKVTREVMESL